MVILPIPIIHVPSRCVKLVLSLPFPLFAYCPRVQWAMLESTNDSAKHKRHVQHLCRLPPASLLLEIL